MVSMPAPGPSENDPELDTPGAASASRIPLPVASFVGREHELTAVPGLLDDEGTRLLTLTGPGGVGKTRLALEVARRIEADFVDGVRYVPLAATRGPGEVLPAVAQQIGASERSDRSLTDTLIEELGDCHLLLVLDNYEHLLSVPPLWLVPVLERCPRIKVLVTSRVPLGLPGERLYRVAPMPVPQRDDLDEASHIASVALFAQRAQAMRSEFVLTPESIRSVSEICRRLDGLPLAIELAAARISVMPPREILARLDDWSKLLESRNRDAPQRHRSMRETVAWSHDLLDAGQQRAFRELSVFSGGFRIEAAVDVIGKPAPAVVSTLVNASLIQVSTVSGNQARYTMLETIRDFGLEQLDASGDADTVRDRHANWCIALARSAEPVDPVVDTTWFDRLEEERPNMVAALTWLEASGRFDDFARLLIGTRWLWYPAGRESEGLGWFDRLLQRQPTMDGATRADTLCWRGHLAQMLKRANATVYLEEALRLAHATGDPHRQAVVTDMLAIMAEDSGDYRRGEALFRTARELYARAGSDWAFLTVDYHLGIVAYGLGDLDRAWNQLDATRQAAEAASEQLVPVWTRNFLALVACEQGDTDRAIATIADQPLDLAGHWHDLPVYIGSVAVIASARHQHGLAARLFGAMSGHDDLLMLPERAAFARAMEASRVSLGEAEWQSEWEQGRRLRRGQIEGEIRRALRIVAPVTTAADDTSPLVDSLTRREREVLRLLANGLTNREIGDALSLSHRTVSTHVNRIMGKLDARSRTAAAAFAIRHGIG